MKNVMRNRFRDSEKSQLVFINIVTILSLLLVIFPLLLIAKYNRPSADDWGYGTNGYHALMSGGNIFDVLKASMKTAQQAYLGWDGRFANDFWDSLQPGIWGEKYYGIVAWLLISMLILTEIFFCRYFIFAKIKKEENRWVYLPIIVPILIMQILYCPSPVESFYWYTGGMNYTFAFSLWLVLFTIYVKLGTSAYTVWWKRWIVCIAAGLLAGLIGGSNFATSLSAVLSLFLVTGVCALQKKKAFIYKTFYIPFIMVVSLLISVFSAGGRAGNANRIIETGGGSACNPDVAGPFSY